MRATQFSLILRYFSTVLCLTGAAVCLAQSVEIPKTVFEVLNDVSQFRDVLSIENLPPKIVALCGDHEGRLANPGKKWEATGSISDDKLPRRRLIWASTNDEYYIVHYEWGGIAHGYQISIFQLQKDRKDPVAIWSAVSVNMKLENYTAFLKTAKSTETSKNVQLLHDERIPSGVDLWHNAPPISFNYRADEVLARTDIFLVKVKAMRGAEKSLQDSSIIEVTDSEASELTGQRIAPVAGKTLFLVRGVYLNRDTGGFWVYRHSNQLCVAHASLGRSAVPMKRQALVVRLVEKPDTVYVTCSMAQ